MTKSWLKSDVCCEPLIWSWYACVDLISPMTAGAHLYKRYLKILGSYLSHPELHKQACQDPKLIGGPYVNFSNNKTSEITELVHEITEHNSSLINLSRALDTLSQRLELETGHSLEMIYQDLPSELAGCVELVYDLYHRANFRVIEPLLYRKYYNVKGQSILLSRGNTKIRPFALSTPRLPASEQIVLNIPFVEKAIDQIAESRRSGCELQTLMRTLDIQEQDKKVFESFFTSTPPGKCHTKHEENTLRIRYFGHACILLETQDCAILIDPFMNFDTESEQDCFSYLDLPLQIDFVLITHAHQDHINLETLLQLRRHIKTIIVPDNNTGFLADPSLKLVLRQLGFDTVISIKELEQISFMGGVITGIPFLGEHGDLNIHSKIAYHINIAHKSLLFAVDSNNVDPNLYKNLSSLLSPVDIIFVGMECFGAPMSWTYGPLLSRSIRREHDQSRRLNGSDSEKTWDIISKLGCRMVVIYAMGQEPWLNHVMGIGYTEDSIQLIESNKILAKCKESGIKAVRPFCKAEWIYSIESE